MQTGVTINCIVLITSSIFIYSTFAGVLEPHNHRRPRSAGDMNFGNQAGGYFGPNGMQGGSNFAPNAGLRNPEQPQLESIYRGKILWGNGTQAKPDNQYVFGTGRLADVETDKFGNPIEQPKKRGPRPKLNPLRKEDEDLRRVRRAVNRQQNYPEALGCYQHQEEQRIILDKFEERTSKEKVHNEMPIEIQWGDQSPLEDTRLKAGLRPKVDLEANDVVNEGPDTVGDTRSVGDILKADFKLRAVPRPNINPVKHELLNEGPDTVGDTRSVGDILKAKKISKDVANEHGKDAADIMRPRAVYTELNNRSPDKNLARDPPPHIIQKRDLPYIPVGIEAIYKGPLIESRYKGPVIESRYRGPQIRSEYTGPQIRAQYMGPQIVSEYKGKVISMLGGVQAYEAMVAREAAMSTPEVICLAQKYDCMNQELERERIIKYVRNKPKLKEIFSDS